MIRVIEWSTLLMGPIFFGLLVGLNLGRRLCPENQFLHEVSEPMLIIAAPVIALAIAGLIVPVPYG